MNIKRFFYILLCILIWTGMLSNVFATDEVNVDKFISEVKGYSNDIFPELSDEDFLNSVLKRRDDS